MLAKSVFDKAGFSVTFCITLLLLYNRSIKQLPAWSSECWESRWAWGTKFRVPQGCDQSMGQAGLMWGFEEVFASWLRLLEECSSSWCRTENSVSLWTISQRSFSAPRVPSIAPHGADPPPDSHSLNLTFSSTSQGESTLILRARVIPWDPPD